MSTTLCLEKLLNEKTSSQRMLKRQDDPRPGASTFAPNWPAMHFYRVGLRALVRCMGSGRAASDPRPPMAMPTRTASPLSAVGFSLCCDDGL